MKRTTAFLLSAIFLLTLTAFAQQEKSSVINIRESRSVTSVTYRAKTSTKIDFKGTHLQPRAEGSAQVESKEGRIKIEARFSKLEPATKLGFEYLTYVLWAITPEGRPINLGEIVLDGGEGKLTVTTRLQSFAMIVTAEPYFSITIPSELVVIENELRENTKGKVDFVDAKFELLKRGHYELAELTPFQMDPKVPLEIYQARNALRIAKYQQADRLVPDSFEKAAKSLAQAEDYNERKQHKSAIAIAREAAQFAEDARVIAEKRAEEERIAEERRQAEEREARARAEAEAETRRREEAEARRKAEEEARIRADLERRAAEEAQLRAEAERKLAEKEKAEAEAQRQAAMAREREAIEKAEREKQELRQKLLEQLNRILPTKDTPRGLQVTMADILFDTGRYNLRPAAREALAKLSGIVLAYSDLKLDIEGHTDNVGGDEYNQKLSEKRAESVKQYLVDQSLSANTVTSRGLGETAPVAENSTAAGRQQNRRVEIIVSGEVIGTKLR